MCCSCLTYVRALPFCAKLKRQPYLVEYEIYIDPFLPKDGRYFVITVSIKIRICLHAKPFVVLRNMAVILRTKIIYLHPHLSL